MFICYTCQSEWPDGQKECTLCGQSARTVFYSEAAQLATFRLMTCSICHALVGEGDRWEHGEWHLRQATVVWR